MENAFLTVLNRSIPASILIMIIFLLRVFLQKSPQSFRCLLWLGVCVRLTLPFAIIDVINLLVDPKKAEHTFASVKNKKIFDYSIITSVFSDVRRTTNLNIQSLLYYVSIIWLSICGMLLMYTLFRYLFLLRKLKVSLHLKNNIWINDEINVPFIWGILKPRIFLPSSTDEQHMKYIVAHEEAHIKRHDYIWKLLGFIIVSVYWFNPLVWIAYFCFCEDIELSCDEKVIQHMNQTERKKYANLLLLYSSRKYSLYGSTLSFSMNGTKTRIYQIVRYRKGGFMNRFLSIIIGIFIGIISLTLPKTDVLSKQVDNFSYETDKRNLSTEPSKEADTNDYLINGLGIGFSNLAPGETMTYENDIFLYKGEELSYQITYFRTGLSAEVILVAEDGTEQVGIAIGGTGIGEFEIKSDGWYTFGIRCSSENLQYKDTTTESLEISGTVVFKHKDEI